MHVYVCVCVYVCMCILVHVYVCISVYICVNIVVIHVLAVHVHIMSPLLASYSYALISIQATTKRSILSSLITNGGLIQHHGGTLLMSNSLYYQYSR